MHVESAKWTFLESEQDRKDKCWQKRESILSEQSNMSATRKLSQSSRNLDTVRSNSVGQRKKTNKISFISQRKLPPLSRNLSPEKENPYSSLFETEVALPKDASAQ
jgi:hypothetical protein